MSLRTPSRARPSTTSQLGTGHRLYAAGRSMEAARRREPIIPLGLGAIGGARAAPPPVAPVRPPVGRGGRWEALQPARPDVGGSLRPTPPAPVRSAVSGAHPAPTRPAAPIGSRMPPGLGDALRVLAAGTEDVPQVEPARLTLVTEGDLPSLPPAASAPSPVLDVPLIRAGEAQATQRDPERPTEFDRISAEPRFHPDSSEQRAISGQDEGSVTMTAKSILSRLMEDD